MNECGAARRGAETKLTVTEALAVTCARCLPAISISYSITEKSGDAGVALRCSRAPAAAAANSLTHKGRAARGDVCGAHYEYID